MKNFILKRSVKVNQNHEVGLGFYRYDPPLSLSLLMICNSLTLVGEDNWLKFLIRHLPFTSRNRRQYLRNV